MVSWNAIIIGCILVILLSSIGSTTDIVGSKFGVLISGGIIGYLVDGNIMNGMIHGAIIGLVGAIILTIFELISHQTCCLTWQKWQGTFDFIISSAIIGSAGGGFISMIGKL